MGEQKVIERILNAVDAAIEDSTKALSAAESLAKSLAQKAITVGVDPQYHFREDANESSKAFKATTLGRFPHDWRASSLGKECRRITDGTHQAVVTSREGVPFLYVSCVRDGLIYWDRAACVSERVYKLISKGRESYLFQPGHTGIRR
jgi:type I restriction enzyme S subunit